MFYLPFNNILRSIVSRSEKHFIYLILKKNRPNVLIWGGTMQVTELKN